MRQNTGTHIILMDGKKFVGLIAFLVAVGMLLMIIANNRLIGLIIIALLLFLGYNCFCGD